MECLIQCAEKNRVMGLGLGQRGGLDTKKNGMGGLDTERLVSKAKVAWATPLGFKLETN